MPAKEITVTNPFKKGQFQPYTAPIYLGRYQARHKCPYSFNCNPYLGCDHRCKYCLVGDTNISLIDSSQKKIKDLVIGEHILGIETNVGSTHVRIVDTTVVDIWVTRKHVYEILFEDGTSVKCSGDHRWLSDRGWKHTIGSECGSDRRAHLTQNNTIRTVFNVYETPGITDGYRRGYLSGIINGDGTIGTYGPYKGKKHTVSKFLLRLNDIEALSRAKDFLDHFGITTTSFIVSEKMRGIRNSLAIDVERIFELIAWDKDNSEFLRGYLSGIYDAEGSYSDNAIRISNSDDDIMGLVEDALVLNKFEFVYDVSQASLHHIVKTIRIRGGRYEHVRFWQLVDPAILRKRCLVGRHVRDGKRVIGIKDLGYEDDLYDITTESGNFIANGMISHNCFADHIQTAKHTRFDYVRPADFGKMKKHIVGALSGKLHDKIAKCIQMRIPIKIGAMTDPFQPVEKDFRITLKLLELLNREKYPVIVNTKGALVAEEPYIGLLATMPSVVQISLLSTDERLVGKLEPNVPTALERLKIIEKLSDNGIVTQLRAAPIIPMVNEDLAELVSNASMRGAKDVLFHILFMKKSPYAFQKLSDALGYNYLLTLKANNHWAFDGKGYGYQMSSYQKYIDTVRPIVEKTGMGFYPENPPISDHPGKSCCGVEQYTGFESNMSWTFMIRGKKITDHTTFAEYIRGSGCPYVADFRRKWDSGVLDQIVPGIYFNPEDKTYSRMDALKFERMCKNGST